MIGVAENLEKAGWALTCVEGDGTDTVGGWILWEQGPWVFLHLSV